MLLLRLAFAVLLFFGATDRSVADEWPPRAADLSVTLARAGGGCLEGEDCRLAMQIENLGSARFKGTLRILVETAAPSVPGFIDTGEGSCERLAYGRMACSAEAIDLAPAETMTGLISVRFLPTVMNAVEACAGIDWSGGSGSVAREAMLAVTAALGKPTTDHGMAATTLPAVFGGWGKGDLRQGNDRGCVTLAIAAASETACPDGQARIGGRCLALDDYCFGNRARDVKTKTCGCPLKGDVFDPVGRRCAAAATACDGGRSATDGMCFCGRERPLWNAATGACEAWPEAAPGPVPVVAVAAPEPEPPPAPKRKLIAPVKKVEAPVKKAEPPVTKVERPVKKQAAVKPETKPAPRRAARRRLESPSAVWRREASRCPPVIPYCWVRVIRRYSKHKRLVGGG
jgi:hypothetical protein